MDKKEVVGAYSEDDVGRALADVAMWCNLHMGEFLDDGRSEFEALCVQRQHGCSSIGVRRIGTKQWQGCSQPCPKSLSVQWKAR